ncbi:MAG: hypothetical protein ACLQUY_03935 [Ktedonobacterales bacterium]
MILLLIAALMGLTALALVVYPLLGLDRNGEAGSLAAPATWSLAGGNASEMSERESAARQALLDVDFDYRLGNLDAEDYSQLRDRYEERALLGLKARYERERELDAAIERQLAAIKGGERKPSAAVATVDARPATGNSSRANAAPTRAASRGAATSGATGPRRRRRKGG